MKKCCLKMPAPLILADQGRWQNGGGGNRTRVRRSLAEGFYMRSRCLKVRSALPPSAGAWGRTSPAWISRPIPPGGEWFASPLNDALSHPAGENGKDVADLSSQCQFFVGSCRFPFVLRANGTSACHLRRNHPRRNLSPPEVHNHVLPAMPVFESPLDLTISIAALHVFALIEELLAAR